MNRTPDDAEMDANCPHCKEPEHLETLDSFSGVCMECYFNHCPHCGEMSLSNAGLLPMMRRCGNGDCKALFLLDEKPIRTLSQLRYVDDSTYTNEQFQKLITGITQ